MCLSLLLVSQVHPQRSGEKHIVFLPYFFVEGFASSLIQPPVTLNVTTSLKSCNASSIACTDMCCCVPRFHTALSSVPITRKSFPITASFCAMKMHASTWSTAPCRDMSGAQCTQYRPHWFIYGG